MPALCCAETCSTRQQPGVSLRRLPRNAEKRKLWVEHIDRPTYMFGNNSYICEAHFSPDQWVVKNGKKRLKSDAVPTRFCRCAKRSRTTPLQPLGVNNTNIDHRYSLTPQTGPLDQVNEGKENVSHSRSARGQPKKGSSTVQHLETCPFRKQEYINDHDYTLYQVTANSPPKERSDLRVSADSSYPAHTENSSTFNVTGVDNSADRSSPHTESSSLSKLTGVDVSTDPSCPQAENSPVSKLIGIDSSADLSSQNEDSFVSTKVTGGDISADSLPKLIGVVNSADLSSPHPDNSSILELSCFDVSVDGSSSHPENSSVSKLERFAVSLMRQNKELRRQNTLWRSRYNRLKTMCDKQLEALQGKFGTDQLDALARGTAKGVKWSKLTVKTALKIHFSCGSAGYGVLSKLQMPLPSVRVLQEKLQHITFQPGILMEIVRVLSTKTENLAGRQKEAMLCFDEMSLARSLVLDPSTKSLIGHCTMPSSKPKVTASLLQQFDGDLAAVECHRDFVSASALNCKAEKAMVFLFRGLFLNYKQIIAYHFTSSTYDAENVKNLLFEIIEILSRSNITIRVVTCDMGNRHVWNAMGVKVGPTDLQNSVPHPTIPGRSLYVMPDVVHVFKNFKEMLVSNKFIKLSPDICKEFNLPSNEVKLEHIISLIKYQDKCAWKLAPKLKMKHVMSNHFNKMKVLGAFHTINRRTAAALIFLSQRPEGEPGMVTTAWLTSLVHKWFQLMTSRNRILALSKTNKDAYEEAVDTLRLTIRVFQTMTIKGGWKPVQTGVKMATATVLNLCELYLDEMEAPFFMTGTLTQCVVENVFSIIRMTRPNPTCLHFKQRLRRITCSHFWKEIPTASYTFDKSALDLVDLLDINEANDDEIADYLKHCYDDEKFASTALVKIDGSFRLREYDMPAFYLTCGYVLFKVLREAREGDVCVSCTYSVQHHSEEPHKYGAFTRLAGYKNNCLAEVSDEVFVCLVNVEEQFVSMAEDLTYVEKDAHIYALKRIKIVPCLTVPDCHNIMKKIVNRFVCMRIKMMSENPQSKDCPNESGSAMSSKSTGSRVLADSFKPKK